MDITCPHCDFSRDVGDVRIPAGGAMAACPRCEGCGDNLHREEMR
jgi:zinc ribbon protein